MLNAPGIAVATQAMLSLSSCSTGEEGESAGKERKKLPHLLVIMMRTRHTNLEEENHVEKILAPYVLLDWSKHPTNQGNVKLLVPTPSASSITCRVSWSAPTAQLEADHDRFLAAVFW